MWQLKKDNGVKKAVCPDCGYDVILNIAKRLDTCPVCGKYHAGTEKERVCENTP